MNVTETVGSPYRGLDAFGDSQLDGLLFFGRERETEVTTANLLASRLTVLYGPSGVGKSSLLRAGVARRVRELGARRAVGRGPDLACVVFAAWADDPGRRLAEAIEETVRPLVSPTALAPPEGARLADVAEHWSGVLDGDVCIVLDQLEEYFVYHEHATGADSFTEQLSELVTRPGVRANVLLALRDDELARLGVLKDRVPHIFANARRLDRLDRDSARAAILGPLQRRNELEPMRDPVDIEPELVEAVLDETAVASQPNRIEAPYLQLVMQRVWEAETSTGSRALRLATLRELGGAEAIVREHLDRALSALDPEQQAAAARMFEHLVTPSGTKIAHRDSDLAAFARIGVADGTSVLEALNRERILRPLDDDGAGGRYEIFHDVLAQAVLEWGRRREVLGERDLARRRQRRLLALAGAALLAVVVMIAVTAYALTQRGDARAQARRASASALASDAVASLPVDPQRSLSLAVDAARREATPETEGVLRTALMAARERAVLRGNSGGVAAVGFVPGGVISIDHRGTLYTFPLHSSGPIQSRPLGGRVRAAAISSGGNAIVVARRRLVEVRNLRSPKASFAFRYASPVRAVALAARGDRVAVATLDGRLTVRGARRVILDVRVGFAATTLALDGRGRTVAAAGGHHARVWSVRGGRVLARVVERKDVTGVALSPAGGLLATAVADGAARLRSLPGGALTWIVETNGASSALTGVAFSRDGGVVVTLGRDGTARTFATDDGREIAVLAGHTDAVTSAAFSPGNARLVTGSVDGTARIWDPGIAADLQVVAQPPACCTALVTGSGGTLVAAGDQRVCRSGRLVHTSGRERESPASLSQETQSSLPARTVAYASRQAWAGPVSGTTGHCCSCNAGTDRRGLVRRGEIEVWSSDGRKLLAFRERAEVAGLAVSPDDRGSRPSRQTTWHVSATWRPAGCYTSSWPHQAGDGGRLHSRWDDDRDVERRSRRTPRTPQPEDSSTCCARTSTVVSGVACSPDGRSLVTAGPTTARLSRMPAGDLLTVPSRSSARLVGAGFSADGRVVETASVDGTVRAARCDLCGSLKAPAALALRRLAAVRQ